MTEEFEKWYEETMLREFGSAGNKFGMKRDHHLLRAFVQEVRKWQESDNFNSGPTDRYNGYPMLDKVVREFMLEEK